MPRLVSKFRYSKSGRKHRENLLEYIATREGVEAPSSEQYLRYIHYRPRSHGLFSSVGKEVNLKKAMQEVSEYDGKIWTAIFSLKREDAQRLGYDSADAWQILLDANADRFADQLKIPLQDFRWYAAFHNEGHHPHIHMVFYAAKPGKEKLSSTGVERIRSALAGQIFKEDLTAIYEDQTQMRNQLTEKAKEEFHRALSELTMEPDELPLMAELIQKLTDQLEKTKGKRVYGYLSADTKRTVDAIIDLLGENEKVKSAYQSWYILRNEVLHTYRDSDEAEKPLSQQKEFRQIKNMVIREVLKAKETPALDSELQAHWQELEENLRKKLMGDEPEAYIRQRLRRIRILQERIKKGDCDAAYFLAKDYLDPKKGLYQPQTALLYLKKSAELGSSMAEYRLGKMALEGEEMEKNVPLAIEYLKSAVQKRNGFAAYLLGKIYIFEEHDWSTAEEYLKMAKKEGISHAKRLLEQHEQYRCSQGNMAASHIMMAFVQLLQEKEEKLPYKPAMKIDRKRLRELRRKKMAQGHAYDDMDVTV